MDKLCLRSYIKTRLLLGSTTTQIHDELTTAYGQSVLSYSSGRQSLDDDPRSGRPLSVITQQNIEAVRDLVNDDPHISIDYIADILDISHGSVGTILKQHLELKRSIAKMGTS
jgi:hypothetical protein